MITVLLSLFLIFIVLVLSEILWNAKILRGELGRKFVHITVGSFVAFWPFFMSFHYIELISIAFLIVVLAVRRLKIFQAIHTVNRESWGDILFAIGIGLTALATSSNWIFTIAILHLSLADGLAAVVGSHFGKNSEYKILGHKKSIVGTLTFCLVSLIILLIALNQGSTQALSLPLLIWLPVAAAALENVAVLGFDNIFVPLLLVVALSPLKFVS